MELAGFFRRLVALIIDLIFTTICLLILNLLLLFVNLDLLTINGINWILVILYFTLMHSSSWQATIGKAIMGIKVTDLNYHRISFFRSLGRYIVSNISFLILLIGYLIQPFTKNKQTLHDIVAGTLVVKE